MTTDTSLADELNELVAWLHERSMTAWTIGALQRELLLRLDECGFHIDRMHIGLPMLHPLYTVGTYVWTRGQGSSQDTYDRGASDEDAWLKSPLKWISDAGLDEYRFHLSEPATEQFPMLMEMRDNGVTEYFVQIAGFVDRAVALEHQAGVAVTWSTADATGFSDAQISFLSGLRLPLSALVKSLAHQKLTQDILDTYLGAYSGSRVLAGSIQRGDAELINAVIFFCDLRGSSTLANAYSPAGFLDLLNQYFEVTAGAVIAHGGELLRFIGDASLAIFPIDKFASERVACEMALLASKEAMERCRLLNVARSAQGEPPIQFGIGLHKGEVLYGNMGIPSRLEFTVIGEAANEAARIEAMCSELGATVLASEAFVQHLDECWHSRGRHRLKNIAEAMEIFSPESASI